MDDLKIHDFTVGNVMDKKKKKSGSRSVAYCSVKGCSSKGGTGISLFRIPKMEPKCTQWKQILGFTGDHKFANLSPDQCHTKIKVCSLHFASNCFSSASRIHSCAVPTLFLNGFENEHDDEFVEEVNSRSSDSFSINGTNRFGSSPRPHIVVNIKPESVLDIQPNEISGSIKSESDDSLDSTNFEPLPPDETFQKDQSTQTTLELTPVLIINAAGKRPGEDLNHNFNKKVERETTLDDVFKFFEKNYSTEACRLLKAQLDVLNSSKNRLGIDDEVNINKHISIRKIHK